MKEKSKRNHLLINGRISYPNKFCEGLARYRDKNKKIGFINTSGDIIIPAKYDKCGNFNEGLCSFKILLSNGKIKLGYLTSDGIETNFNHILNTSESTMPHFSNGWTKINNQFYDLNGNLINRFKHLKVFYNLNPDRLTEVFDGSRQYLINNNLEEVKIIRHNKVLAKTPHPLSPFFIDPMLKTYSNGIYLGCYETRSPMLDWWYNFYKYDIKKNVLQTFNDTDNNYKYAGVFYNGLTFARKNKSSKGSIINTDLQTTYKLPENWIKWDWHQINEHIISVAKFGSTYEYNFYDIVNKKILFPKNLMDVNLYPVNNRMIRIQNDIMTGGNNKFYYLNSDDPFFKSREYEDANEFSHNRAFTFDNNIYKYIDKEDNTIFKFS